MIDILNTLVFYWLAPMALAGFTFFLLNRQVKRLYDLWNVDRVYAGLGWLTLGLLIILTVWYVGGLFHIWTMLGSWWHQLATTVSSISLVVSLWMRFTAWFMSWVPVYVRGYVLIFVPVAYVQLYALKWHVRLSYALTIVIPTVIGAFSGKYLFQFLLGRQTPMSDKFHQRFLQYTYREGGNDALNYALRGKDDKGEKFDKGVGGSVSTEIQKKIGRAFRDIKVSVETVAKKGGGYERRAEVYVRFPPDLDAKNKLEGMLKGMGSMVYVPSISFPDDPTRREGAEDKKPGYIFESVIDYDASDALGGFLSIFANPFAEENLKKNGGSGVLKVFLGEVKATVDYIIHLTPAAIARRYENIIKRRWTPDYSIEKAKYKAQQNLDLSVIPEPKDNQTGNSIEIQRQRALKVAKDREPMIMQLLMSNKFKGISKKPVDGDSNVIVGGNTAVYNYNLPMTNEIPTDFDKIASNLSNNLRMSAVPQIMIGAGSLTVTMVNGVNIPVDFRKMIINRKKAMPGIISGMAGVDALDNPIYVELGDKNPHAMLFGKTGTGKTVTIMTILYAVMSAVDPSMLRLVTVDGKGNSFEFLRTDDTDGEPEAPNPFMYTQPADASGDIEYARAVVSHLVKLTRSRIDMFKKANVTKLADYNNLHPDDKLPEILAVIDEFSAITDQDTGIPMREVAQKNVTDKFEYIAKMSRSVGLRMLLANQTARKEKVPGKITANVTGRISLGVSEPMESEIALPDAGIKLHQISQPGEFYSIMNGPNQAEHGNSPYLTDDQMKDLNRSLWKKFGPIPYVKTRSELMMEYSGEEYPIPKDSEIKVAKTDPDKLIKLLKEFPEWGSHQGKTIQDNWYPQYEKNLSPEVYNEKTKAVTAIIDKFQEDKANSHTNGGIRTKRITTGTNSSI